MKKPPKETKETPLKPHVAAKRRRGGQVGNRNNRGGDPNAPLNKGTALAVVDFFGGNKSRAAAFTGLSVRTLYQYQQEIDPDGETQRARGEGRATMLEVLRNYIEALAVIALMKAGDASFYEITGSMGMMLERLEKLARVQSLPLARAPEPDSIPTPAPAPVETPDGGDQPDPVYLEQKAHWEGLVQRVIDESVSDKKPLDRDQAIEAVIKAQPEAAVYLREPSEQNDYPM